MYCSTQTKYMSVRDTKINFWGEFESMFCCMIKSHRISIMFYEIWSFELKSAWCSEWCCNQSQHPHIRHPPIKHRCAKIITFFQQHQFWTVVREIQFCAPHNVKGVLIKRFHAYIYRLWICNTYTYAHVSTHTHYSDARTHISRKCKNSKTCGQ